MGEERKGKQIHRHHPYSPGRACFSMCLNQGGLVALRPTQ